MKQTWLAAGVISAAALLLALIWLKPAAPNSVSSKATPKPTPAVKAQPTPSPPSRPTEKPDDQAPSPPPEPARKRLVIPPPADQAPREEDPDPPIEDDEGPVDLRTEGAPVDRKLLKDGMEAIGEDTEDCLERAFEQAQWPAGRVSVFFRIDREGLMEAWIDEHDELPEASLNCLTDAVYGLDWQGISEDPIQVSMPFDIGDEELLDE